MCQAITTAKGEKAMKTIEDGTTTLEAQAAPATETQDEKATTKAKVAKPARRVAPEKATSKKKAAPAKKAAKVSQNTPKAAKKTAPAKKSAKAKESDGPREGSKTAQVVAMLQRKNGATLAEIMKTMGWQKHTVRGFMAGAMKKAGYAVESFKPEGGERTYRINS
jgi:cell pole-organizing protein PopZ